MALERGDHSAPSPMRGDGEDGIALIAVLWGITLLSIIAAALAFETRSNISIARNMADNATTRQAADAGIQRAILDLLNSSGTSAAGKFRTDGTAYSWRFADNTVQITIRDERGKINLNDAPDTLLTKLFVSAGLDQSRAQSLADAVADYRDADDLPRLSGAEESQYRDAGLAWGPRNAPFQSVDELQQVLGVTPAIYARVAPDLTIYSIGAINPKLANERMAAILRGEGTQISNTGGGPEVAYSVRASAKGPNGAAFVREAVVEATGNPYTPLQILAWR